MRVLAVLALSLPMLATLPGCNLTSRGRVNSINRMNNGIEHVSKNNLSGAEKSLKEAIELDPTHAKAHFTLGQIYTKQSKLVDAAKAYQGAIDNMSEAPDPSYYHHLGAVIADQAKQEGTSQTDREAKWGEAIAAFQEAIKLDPNYYKSHYRMGVLYEKLDQPQSADSAYRKVIEVRPDYSPAFVSLGNMYIDYGFANIAMSVLETGTKINDKDARMWNGLGRAQHQLNNAQAAVDAFLKAKAIDPDMVDVLFGLGMAYADLRNRKDAVENLNAFLQKAGGNVPPDKTKAANDTVARMQDVI